MFVLRVSSLYAHSSVGYAVLETSLNKRFAVFTDAKSIKVRLSQSSGWNKLLTSIAYRARNTSV